MSDTKPHYQLCVVADRDNNWGLSEEGEMNENRCPTCLEQLCNPILLPCGHRFCMKCVSPASYFKKGYRCPVCQQEHTLGTFELILSLVQTLVYSRCVRVVIGNLLNCVQLRVLVTRTDV